MSEGTISLIYCIIVIIMAIGNVIVLDNFYFHDYHIIFCQLTVVQPFFFGIVTIPLFIYLIIQILRKRQKNYD